MKAILLVYTLILLLVACLMACSSAVIVKDCEHMGSGVYRCQKL